MDMDGLWMDVRSYGIDDDSILAIMDQQDGHRRTPAPSSIVQWSIVLIS